MTKKQVRERYKAAYPDFNEKVVDVNIYKLDVDTYATVITVTSNHIVWKNWVKIEDGDLVFIDSKCLV